MIETRGLFMKCKCKVHDCMTSYLYVPSAGIKLAECCLKAGLYKEVYLEEAKKTYPNFFTEVPEKKMVTIYLHSDKDSMVAKGEKYGMTKGQIENFKTALYEVRFDVEVDKQGFAKILKVDGHTLI